MSSASDVIEMVGRRLQDDNATDLEELVPPNDSQVLRNTLRLYGSIFLVLLLIFCVVRKRFPRAYNVRNWVPELECDLAKEQYGFLSWMWKLYLVSDDDILEQCGMDALCFLRILTFGFKVSVMGIFCSVWLMPIYATAPDSDETSYIEDRVASLSIAHVPPSNPRLIATTVAAYIVFGYTMYLILQDLQWFTEKRHLFLSKTMARNYTVYVRHICTEYRSSAALLNYFRECFSYDAVLEAHVALDIPKLEKKVATREAVVNKLEHAISVEEITGDTPTHIKSLKGEKVNSIEAYSEELWKLNEEITEEITTIERMHEPKTYQEDLDEAQSQSVLHQNLRQLGVGDQADYSLASSLTGAYIDEAVGFSSAPSQASKQAASNVELEDTNNRSRKNGVAYSAAKLSASTKKFGSVAIKALITGDEDGKARESGFVSFTNLFTTHAALQMIQHPTPFMMEVFEAPNPEDIFWGNVGKTHKKLQIGNLVGLTLTAILCIFWTIPVAFVTSLSQVDALQESIPFLKDWLEKAPWLEPVLAQLAPLLIVVLNLILPYILIEFAKLEGPISTSVLEASLFVKLAIFMIIQTFFVSAISGSIFQEISNIIANPTSAIDLLATSLPSQALFYVQILLVSTFLGLGIEVLRVSPIATAWLRSKVGPNLTEKERNRTWLGLRPLADPLEFEFAEVLAEIILYFMVTFVYSTMAPLTNLFLALCYLLLGSGYRNQFIHIYPTTPDSGGKLWTGFIGIAITCMIIAEFTLFGYLGLKKAPVSAGLMVPLIIVTFLFNSYIRQQHFRVTDHLPTRECHQIDLKKNSNGPMDFDFVKEAYLQPALKEKEVQAENFGIDREVAQENLVYLTPPGSEAELLDDMDFGPSSSVPAL